MPRFYTMRRNPCRNMRADGPSPPKPREIHDSYRRNTARSNMAGCRYGGHRSGIRRVALALGGWIGALVIMMFVPTPRRRDVGAIAFAIVGGLTVVASLHFVIGTFDGNFWITAWPACSASPQRVSPYWAFANSSEALVSEWQLSCSYCWGIPSPGWPAHQKCFRDRGESSVNICPRVPPGPSCATWPSSADTAPSRHCSP